MSNINWDDNAKRAACLFYDFIDEQGVSYASPDKMQRDFFDWLALPQQKTVADAANMIERLSEQLAKANESALFYKEQYEKTDRECTKLAMRESKANERVSRLEKILQRYESQQLQPLKQRVKELEKENKRESMELRSRLSSALGRNSEYNSAIENMQQKLAKANERVRELELHANSIADALGFNAENNNRFATSVICTNIRNLHSFSDCLSRIENAFLMVESETDEFGETSEDVAFSKWGLTPHEYCIEFGKWLNKFAIENQAKGAEALIYAFPLNGSDQMKEWVEQLRKEQEK